MIFEIWKLREIITLKKLEVMRDWTKLRIEDVRNM